MCNFSRCYCAKKPTKKVLAHVQQIHGSIKNIAIEMRVPRRVISEWMHEYNLIGRGPRKKSVVVRQQIRQAIMQQDKQFTTSQILDTINTSRTVVLEVLRALRDSGNVEKLGDSAQATTWRVATNHARKRWLAGWPSLEKYQKENDL